MKTLRILTFVLLAAIFVVSSCKKDEDQVPRLTQKYLSIEGAKYKSGKIPSGEEELISDIQVNNSVINGGSAILTITATEELEEIYISVEGVSGYYTYPIETSGLVYQIIINLSQELDAENLTINVSAKSISGSTSTMEATGTIQVIEVGTGMLQISLSWDKSDDLDIHLYEPNGTEIYYNNTVSINGDKDLFYFEFSVYLVEKYTNYDTSSLDPNNEDDLDLLDEYIDELPDDLNLDDELIAFDNPNFLGFLDLDSNADCDIDGINNENITYINPPTGEYTLAVDLYKKCQSYQSGANFSVTAIYNGKAISLTNPIGQFADNDPGSRDKEDRYIIIGTFKIQDQDKSSSTMPNHNTKQQKTTQLEKRIIAKYRANNKSR